LEGLKEDGADDDDDDDGEDVVYKWAKS